MLDFSHVLGVDESILMTVAAIAAGCLLLKPLVSVKMLAAATGLPSYKDPPTCWAVSFCLL